MEIPTAPQNNQSLERGLDAIAAAIYGARRDPTVLSPDVGDFKWRPMSSVPTGYLLCDGTAVSRATYLDLFDYLCPVLGTFTITIATPGVATLVAHGLTTGEAVYLTTTGALPTGLSANTVYYFIKSTADVFWLATTRANAIAGTKIATSGSQSGVHTIVRCPYGLGNGSTTFNVPSVVGKVLVGVDIADNNFLAAGTTGGETAHLLTSAESGLPAHTHGIPVNNGTVASLALVRGADNVNYATKQTDANTAANAASAHNNLQPYNSAYCFIKY